MKPAREHLIDADRLGYLAAQLDEVGRMLDIYDHEIAKARPEAAWGALPLGMPADDTLEHLSKLPVEAPKPGLHAERLNVLELRFAALEAEHTAFINSKTKRKEDHVH